MTTTTRLICGIVTVIWALAPTPATAQRAGDDWCREQSWGDDRAGFCEVRELTLPTSGSLTVDASPNGGIKVEGAPRYDVQLRARVVATAATEERARQIAGLVRVQSSGDRIAAEGPSRSDGLQQRESWSVSYELAVPMQMSLALKTTNGGIGIRDVEGKIEFTTTNGGVKLANVGGEVQGRTTNGGVDIELDGVSWRGEGLDVQTTNGGVRLSIPENYSARLEAGTVNGGLNSEFPVVTRGQRPRDIEATLGAGGAPIRVRTSNGGVRITKR
jgi:hypothetical protein